MPSCRASFIPQRVRALLYSSFAKEAASLPKMGDISSPSVQNVNREGEIFVLPRNSYDDFELNGHIKCLNVRYDTCGVVTNSYVN